MSEIRPRIVGSEMEWPIVYKKAFGNGQTEQFESIDPLLNAYLDKRLVRTQNGMLSNGGRMYKEPVGPRVEYATPEDTSFEGLLANEIAGEQIAIDSLIEYIRNSNVVESMYANKRVIDQYNNTWGYHINLSADTESVQGFSDEKMHLLGLHIASSQPILGSGVVTKDARTGQTVYSFGQKILDVKCDYNSGTTNQNKAIINQRTKAMSEGTDDSRVHITCADAHISPWATKMGAGTSSLVLRAIEQGKGDHLRLRPDSYFGSSTSRTRALVELGRLNSLDKTMAETVRMADGQDMTPLNIQEELINIVSDTYHTDEEEQILEEWKRAVGDMQQNIMLLADRSDAIAKLSLIRRFAQKNDVDLDYSRNPAYKMIDMKYDMFVSEEGLDKDSRPMIDRDEIYKKSMPYKLRHGRNMKQWLPSSEAIEQAKYNPPTTTRAYRRANAIKSGEAMRASWSRYSRENNKEIVIGDPYDKEYLDSLSEES